MSTQLLHFLDQCSSKDLEFLYQEISMRLKPRNAPLLANEILSHIFSYIHDPKTLMNCSLVCQSWHHLLTDNVLWKRVCHRVKYTPLKAMVKTGGQGASTIPTPLAIGIWKNIYMQNYLTWMNWRRGSYRVFPLKQIGRLCLDFDDQFAVSIAGDAVRIVIDLT